MSKLSLPVKLPFQRLLGNWKQDITKCWSSLSSINWCIDEIYGTLSRGKFGVDGRACCLSIGVVSNRCWPKMFPFNPLFPWLLKSKCGFKATPKPRRIWSCLWIWTNSSLAAMISKCIGRWLRENVVFSWPSHQECAVVNICFLNMYSMVNICFLNMYSMCLCMHSLTHDKFIFWYLYFHSNFGYNFGIILT